MNPGKWESKSGIVRWQPRLSDGRVLWGVVRHMSLGRETWEWSKRVPPLGWRESCRPLHYKDRRKAEEVAVAQERYELKREEDRLYVVADEGDET